MADGEKEEEYSASESSNRKYKKRINTKNLLIICLVLVSVMLFIELK